MNHTIFTYYEEYDKNGKLIMNPREIDEDGNIIKRLDKDGKEIFKTVDKEGNTIITEVDKNGNKIEKKLIKMVQL